MDLIIPYVSDLLDQGTREFGERNGAAFISMDATPYLYWSLFAGRFLSGEPFAICEHDIVPTDDDWRELQDCPQPWCAFSYDRFGTSIASMGFCKFDPARLGDTLRNDTWYFGQMTQESREHITAQAMTPPIGAEIPWNLVDGVVWTILDTRGYHLHRHGSVAHRRERRAVEV